jgi:hypothetical protein
MNDRARRLLVNVLLTFAALVAGALLALFYFSMQGCDQPNEPPVIVVPLNDQPCPPKHRCTCDTVGHAAIR